MDKEINMFKEWKQWEESREQVWKLESTSTEPDVVNIVVQRTDGIHWIAPDRGEYGQVLILELLF